MAQRNFKYNNWATVITTIAGCLHVHVVFWLKRICWNFSHFTLHCASAILMFRDRTGTDGAEIITEQSERYCWANRGGGGNETVAHFVVAYRSYTNIKISIYWYTHISKVFHCSSLTPYRQQAFQYFFSLSLYSFYLSHCYTLLQISSSFCLPIEFFIQQLYFPVVCVAIHYCHLFATYYICIEAMSIRPLIRVNVNFFFLNWQLFIFVRGTWWYSITKTIQMFNMCIKDIFGDCNSTWRAVNLSIIVRKINNWQFTCHKFW